MTKNAAIKSHCSRELAHRHKNHRKMKLLLNRDRERLTRHISKLMTGKQITAKNGPPQRLATSQPQMGWLSH